MVNITLNNAENPFDTKAQYSMFLNSMKREEAMLPKLYSKLGR